MDNETISGRCRNIRQQLTDLLTVLETGSAQVSTTVTSSSIKDVLERFMLWAGNLGALRKPASKLSLDSRLANSSDLRDYICTELEDMSEAIEDLMNIVNGSMPNREIGYGSGSENDLDMESDESSYSDGPIDEAGSILQVISQGITSLLKIGILVRQPASSGTDRFHRASRDSTNAFLDRFDIDYVQHKHPKLGSGEQSSRMGKAISKRRQFIRYCRDHKSNLAAEEDEGKIGSQKATTAKQSSKATTFVAKENLMDILQGSVDALEEEDDAVSHCSVSTTSESLAILKLPRLADLSPEDDPFECPICYTLQQFRSEQAWRRHAYRDLKAYVCTVGGTECDDKFFDDRTSWFNHELEHHRCSYVCVLCGANDGQNKRKRDELRQHILSAHGDFESDQLERLEDAGRDTVTTFKANDCPFCDDWSELIARKMPSGKIAQPGDDFVVSTSRFKKHVAMHLEQLAIFALPRYEHDTGMDEDGSHGSDSRVMDSRSSASFAGSFGPENERFIEDYQGDQMMPIDQKQAVLSRMKSQHTPLTGWQATHIQLPERVKKLSTIATNLKLAGEVESWQEAVNHAIEFERRLFIQSPDKPTYEYLMCERFQQLVEQRQARASFYPQQRSANYWARRWRQITDIPRDNSDEEWKEEDDWNTSDLSLQRKEVRESSPVRLVRSSYPGRFTDSQQAADAAKQQAIARQEEQQPHMMALETRDVVVEQEKEEPPSAPAGPTRQGPKSEKHPDQFHNKVSPEHLQSWTTRVEFFCPVSSCRMLFFRKDHLSRHLFRKHGARHGRFIVDADEPVSMSSTIDDGPDEDTRSLETSPSRPRSDMVYRTSRDEYSQTHARQTESSLRDEGQQRLAQAEENLDRLEREQAEERKQKKLQEKLELRKAKEEPDGSRKKKGEEEQGGGGTQLQDKEEEEEKLLRAKSEETLKRLQYEGAKVKERNLNEEEKRIAKEGLKGEEEKIRRQEEERRTRKALAAKDARDPLRDTAKYQTETVGDSMPITAETLHRAAEGRNESDHRHSVPASTASTQSGANPHEDVTVRVMKGGAVLEVDSANLKRIGRAEINTSRNAITSGRQGSEKAYYVYDEEFDEHQPGLATNQPQLNAMAGIDTVIQNNAPPTENFGNGWEGGDNKREQQAGNLLKGDNMFSDLGEDLVEDYELTDADFDFFDEQLDEQPEGVKMNLGDLSTDTGQPTPPQQNDNWAYRPPHELAHEERQRRRAQRSRR